MKHCRILSLSILLAFCLPAAAANNCAEACKRLVGEAHIFVGQGKFQEALAKFKEAEQAEPQASLPLSSAAALVLHLSQGMKPEQRTQLRAMARALATRAAALAADDPLAQETLRLLDDDAPSPLRAPNPAAAKLVAEAESLFAQRKYKEALPRYEAAMAADPQYSGSWIGAGDCYFLQQDWARAEALFQRAAEIEPRNAQAWRFLADARLHQGKRREAEAALLSAIAADPSQRPNWSRLADLRTAAGMPLQSLAFRRGTRVEQDKDGKYTIQVDGAASQKQNTPDYAIRLALAMAEANQRSKDAARAKSAYDIELESWRLALKVADEAAANGGAPLTDPALLRMQAMARDGQLEPAILILLFRQAYRPALEAWMAANPGGVKAFIDRHGLQP
jgi:tetratricopeptide (TPR) repeat protein